MTPPSSAPKQPRDDIVGLDRPLSSETVSILEALRYSKFLALISSILARKIWPLNFLSEQRLNIS